jgi:hypothetical protein
MDEDTLFQNTLEKSNKAEKQASKLKSNIDEHRQSKKFVNRLVQSIERVDDLCPLAAMFTRDEGREEEKHRCPHRCALHTRYQKGFGCPCCANHANGAKKRFGVGGKVDVYHQELYERMLDVYREVDDSNE